MQLQDLKSLFIELPEHKQKVNDIKNNDDLSKNQMKQQIQLILPRMQEIETVLKKYNSAFDVNTKCFVEKFKELYLKENSNATVDSSHECVGETIEQEHFYGVHKYYKGLAYLNISTFNKNNKTTFALFKREITESLDLDLDYILGNYEVNVYDVLNNKTLPHFELLHKACWLAMKENIKQKNLRRIDANNTATSLIKQQIKKHEAKIKDLKSQSLAIKENDEIIILNDTQKTL